ncbi:hypothetical protein IPC1122_09150 [Pseudomonas aeruginosa]|uniref:DNA adenine methylase n=1 Tax=Pseudomonas aeruginosa TaxID=287 RepID=UPI00053E8250|nr:DNA adenine methylase [Pseudomonas aeruginosa]MDI3611681.1 DNA adenine methylase [Pseudomonas aeruginosa]MDI4012100.1 DNA adenine methylase [Pseudomonas aeruginosa]MDI4025032.1 DNA adenine methylase [Pseudomonas aeruginosa]RPQ23646.1 hypothetical protein IPC1122_09150 [Pseudomonas aeruginosa]HBO3498547.1 DNA adenine methylase [Pseudomonas aeruginosa]
MFRYFGSKASTAHLVADIALRDYKDISVADAFGGLGNIGAEFKKRGCAVTACDLLHFPNSFQHTRLACTEPPTFSKILNKLNLKTHDEILTHLNQIRSNDSWLYHEYAEKRAFFTKSNADRINSAWREIANWKQAELLSIDEEKFLTASLLNSMDAVANTAGTYYAHLKNWNRKSIKDFHLDWFPGIINGPKGTAILGDALSCLSGKKFDILYLDPPYNNRDYSRYYHLPETLATYRESIIDPHSKCGQPLERPSKGPQIRNAMKLPYLLDLIDSVKWERLVIQYADGAYIPLEQLQKELTKFGRLKVHKIAALGYQSTKGTRRQIHHVFIIDK